MIAPLLSGIAMLIAIFRGSVLGVPPAGGARYHVPGNLTGEFQNRRLIIRMLELILSACIQARGKSHTYNIRVFICMQAPTCIGNLGYLARGPIDVNGLVSGSRVCVTAIRYHST